MHVLIIGGALSGLSLAQMLRKHGISFTVFERDETPDSRFQGWAIALHSILGDLKASFPDDMPDMLRATSHLAPLDLPAQMAFYVDDHSGRTGAEHSEEVPWVRCERRRLRDWLSTKIPVQWNKRMSSMKEDDSGVTVYFEDGTSARGDIVVGADGFNSAVRRSLLGKPLEDLVNLVPFTNIIGEVTLSGAAFERQLSLGHSAYRYGPTDSNYVLFVGLHCVLPDGLSGKYYWILGERDTTAGCADHWLRTATPQQKLDYIMELTKNAPPKLREILELTPVSGIQAEFKPWRDMELESLPTGRVALVGDAAHTMTPFRGEGGMFALIDSLDLGKRLAGAKSEDIVGLVREYHDEMLARSGPAVRRSRGATGKPDGGTLPTYGGRIPTELPPETISLATVKRLVY
ncbi:hypothetical protein VHEMI05968 [[Torrubiella] hemipterigena]|uniref:FAD-binding domain-containing protein n=1 Tax=[Torrubiella] hemipterigena TaxID=1531966 RepID=A0A0A1TID6_9HYPO|nr:hypothetical protein VHEMI05968 [[Torrubiella] hemipterigena]